MTLGIAPFGVGLLGVDVPLVNAPPGNGITPAALFFDPSARQYQQTGADFTSIHPIDAQVALALGVELGTIKSAPKVGNRVRKLLQAAPAHQRQGAAEAGVKEALATLLANGDVTILSVTVDTPLPNVVTTSYVNNRLQPGQPDPYPIQVRP